MLSASPSYAETLKESRPKAANLLAELKADIDRPLAAILTLNTIAHTVGAIGVGAEAGAIWGSIGVGIASTVMTILVLFLSEIIPKTIGAVFWRRLSVPTAYSVNFLIKALLPIIWFSELMTKLVSSGHEPEPVTRDEVAAVAEMSAESGELRVMETRILKNLLSLNVLTAADIMTPQVLQYPRFHNA